MVRIISSFRYIFKVSNLKRKETFERVIAQLQREIMVCVGQPFEVSKKLSMQAMLTFIAMNLKKTRYFDMARNTNSVIVLVRDIDFT